MVSKEQGAKPKEPKVTMKNVETLIKKVESMDEHIKSLEEFALASNDLVQSLSKEVTRLASEGIPQRKGPKSTREMTEDDARQVVHGNLKDMPIRKAAETLGLSYGQVYSAKGGYTFKGIKPVTNG